MTNLICSFHGTYHLPPYCSVLLQCKFWGNWNFLLCILSSHEAIILLIPNWGKGLGNLAEKSESENLNLLYHEKLLIGIDVCRENTTLVPLSLINDDAFCFKWLSLQVTSMLLNLLRSLTQSWCEIRSLVRTNESEIKPIKVKPCRQIVLHQCYKTLSVYQLARLT